MKKHLLALAAVLFCSVQLFAQSLEFKVECTNPISVQRSDVPVVIDIRGKMVKSAEVKFKGEEMAYQVDDLNGDGQMDELCFLADFGKKEVKQFDVTLSTTGTFKTFKSRVYAEMLLNNPKEKGKRQTSYISALTVDNDVNPYNLLQHHGPAFESELVAYRIYFDSRQTVDIYGKYNKGLEIKQTQFYPTKDELASGFGDDCLWVGGTLGVGTLRGWDGKEPKFLDKVAHRTERIISRGPLRTIVEVEDNEWNTYNIGKSPVDMITRYTLYAGHRDVDVNIRFVQSADTYTFCTGVINVKNSTEYSNKSGLRGCWGTDWPVSEKDSAGHKRETVGLAIYVPKAYFKKELPADKDNYPILVAPANSQIDYHIAFGSDNEKFGYHSDKDWYRWMQSWKKEIDNPVICKRL